MLRRLLVNLILGLLLSILGAAIMLAIGLIANLPRIIQGAIWVLRRILLISYQTYLWILSSLRKTLSEFAGLDVFSPTTRTIASLLFSVAIGAGVLGLLNLPAGIWWVVIFATHGLVVGYFWDQLAHPGEFQLGNPVERWP